MSVNPQALLKMLATGGEQYVPVSWEDVVSTLASTQEFWGSIPVRALESSTTDLSACVMEMATTLFGKEPSKDEVTYTRAVLKRLRQYIVYGRSQYTVKVPTISELVRKQHGRCRTCGYRFTPDDFRAREFLDEPEADAQIGSLMPPQLDHVVPIFLGPHHVNNWQILCRRCNLLKNAALLWPLKPSLIAPFRPSELLVPSETLGWMAMVRAGRCERCKLKPVNLRGENSKLSVERANPSRGWVLANLLVICSDCRAAMPNPRRRQ